MAEAIRVAVVGMSNSPTCGVRDHAGLLAGALEREGISCSMHWLNRDESSLGESRTEIAGWSEEIASELRRTRPDVILAHYSTFAYSHRGIPLFLRPTIAGVKTSGIPLVSFMHEFVYPWRVGDLRGNVWALAQRAALIELVRRSSAIVVTTEERARWFASRRWLARRPSAVAPVFSNLPPPSPAVTREAAGNVVGLFGYSYQGAAVSLVLDAIGLLRERGQEVQLRLLGAPGPNSGAGEEWQREAAGRGLSAAISFTGPLPAEQLSDALAACEVLLSADPPGPTARKGTLAGSLASGRPVIAIDGPQRWQALVDAEAALVVQPEPQAMAAALAVLLGDAVQRELLGERGQGFAEQQMGLRHSAQIVAEVLRNVLATQRAHPPSGSDQDATPAGAGSRP